MIMVAVNKNILSQFYTPRETLSER